MRNIRATSITGYESKWDWLDASTIDVVCSRDGVPYRRLDAETVRLQGRRGATGGWTGLGGRLARCASHLIAAPMGMSAIGGERNRPRGRCRSGAWSG